MRVLVVGVGVIGAIYGWALADGGCEVAHLVRPGRGGALGVGLALDLLDCRGQPSRRDETYRPNVVEDASAARGFELIVVPVKHYALLRTLAEIVPHCANADFLLLTQNWRGVKEVEALLAPARYVYGDAKAGGRLSGATLVGALKSIDIGPAEGQPSPLTDKVAALFAAAKTPAAVHPDMLHYLWIQYAITAGLWAALIGAGSFDALLNDRRAMSTAFDAVRECLDVVRRRGVDLALYPETKPFLTDSAVLRWLSIRRVTRMFQRDEYQKRTSAHAFGDPVEVQTFYDDLMATGGALGAAMPVMAGFGAAVGAFAQSEARGSKPTR